MARSRSSGRWLKEHFNDPYVKRAQKEGYHSRAAYKLLELQEKDKLIRPGMTIVDLGAAPGGWTQVLAELTGPSGYVVAFDCLPMEAVPGALCIQGDFTQEAAVKTLMQAIDERPIDVVVSDMAPNLSGIKGVDQPRGMYLIELSLDFAAQHLREGGHFVTKVFQGEGFDAILKQARQQYHHVFIRKPQASRSRSPELYLVAKQLRAK